MDLKLLKTFIVASECLNFTKTARILNFAQSSVTAHIRTLEEEIGTPLFERLGKRVVLTEAGRRLEKYAVQMIRIEEEMKESVSHVKNLQGSIIIGAQESQCTYRLPPILKKFTENYPNVKLIFKPSHSDGMAREQLVNGELDIAFIMDVKKPVGSLIQIPLKEESIVLVAGQSHKLFDKAYIKLEDLEEETLLLTEMGCSYRSLLEQSLQSKNIYPINKYEFVSIEAIKQCVIAGIGIAVLPLMALNKEIEQGLIKPLRCQLDTPSVFTHLAWHKDKWISPPLKAFIELTKETIQTSKNFSSY